MMPVADHGHMWTGRVGLQVQGRVRYAPSHRRQSGVGLALAPSWLVLVLGWLGPGCCCCCCCWLAAAALLLHYCKTSSRVNYSHTSLQCHKLARAHTLSNSHDALRRVFCAPHHTIESRRGPDTRVLPKPRHKRTRLSDPVFGCLSSCLLPQAPSARPTHVKIIHLTPSAYTVLPPPH